MSNRKHKVAYRVVGKNYYNEPYSEAGTLTEEQFEKIKYHIKTVNEVKYWCKELIYCGLYPNKFFEDKEAFNIINSILSPLFFDIDRITIYKNFKDITP